MDKNEQSIPIWASSIIFIVLFGLIMLWAYHDEPKSPKYDEQMSGAETPYRAP